MKRVRRTPVELIIEILKTCNNKNINKTRIINITNLNSKIGSDYIRFLIEKEYLVHNGNTYIGHRLRPPFFSKSFSVDMRIKCLALVNIHDSLKSSVNSIVSKYKS